MTRPRLLILPVIAWMGCSVGQPSKAIPDLLISGRESGPRTPIGTYGTTQAFGPSGGVEIAPELRRAMKGEGPVRAVFEGVSFDGSGTVDVYLIEGWDYAASESELDVSKFVGSFTAQALTRPFPVEDGKGSVRTFLKGDVKRLTLVLMFRNATMTFERLRINAGP